MKQTASVLKPKVKDEEFDIGLTRAYRQEMAAALSDILADTYKLVIKSHIYHWNVVGPLFKPLHELTEEHYNTLFQATDVIAERIRALGHLAPAKLTEAAAFAPSGGSVNHASAADMVADLIADHEAAVRRMRDAGTTADENDDLVTTDMLTDRLNFHEKALWMLRAIVAA
ncbi:DNA starvation/stationary phase protection protein [Ensifer sp. ENS10]|uniref:Dps family protein n=1 Tax=unclassified Ensifer TaxID=2633371 RepID=UPI00070F8468|nr:MULTISPECIES: DNA starvation/stationary phase protection protein [unclassified Ensifer]KRD69782.1 DNA starvation/stationary phase protection protein [Ensifer sp. Root278]MBD9507713.1 DNA starvation/stationary phase protection protein [Ensifer sp. ENS10]